MSETDLSAPRAGSPVRTPDPGPGAVSRLLRLLGRPVIALGFDPRRLRDMAPLMPTCSRPSRPIGSWQ